MTRGLGWRRDSAHQRPRESYQAPRGFQASDVAPWSVRASVQGISDQGLLGACTGVSTVRAIQTYDAANGVAAPVLGSALAAYFGGRLKAFHDAFPGTSVATFEAQDSDDGSTHAAVFAAIQQLGLPPEEAWPYSDANTGSTSDPFRRRPSAAADRLAFDARSLSFQCLRESADAKIVDLNHAGASKAIIAIGILADQAFVDEAFDPSIAYTPDTSRPVGGHALYLVEMRINPDTSAREYCAAMSWGDGPYAYAWLSEACILAPSTQLTVIQRAPVVDAGGAS